MTATDRDFPGGYSACKARCNCQRERRDTVVFACAQILLVSATSRRSFDAEVIGRTGDGGPKLVSRR